MQRVELLLLSCLLSIQVLGAINIHRFSSVIGRNPSPHSTIQEHPSQFLRQSLSDEDWPVDPDELECKVLPPYQPPINDTDNLSLWELLEKSRSQLTLSEKFKDVTLLLGNTGSGKTTVTQVVAGDPGTLEVVKTNDRANYIIIDSAQKIGRSTASKTLVPELVVDPNSALAIYDCPGFSDNRGPDIDITINYLLNAVTNHVSSVKLVFVVIYSAVKGTNDKTNFDQLAGHAVQLMANLNKFNHSVSLFVTKAPKLNQKGKPIPESTLQNGVRGFLTDYKGVQEDLVKDTNTPEEKELIRKKIEFVDTLFQQDRIVVIRTVVDCGTLSNDPDMMASREHIRNLLTNKLEAAPVTPKDFGYALTDGSLIKIDEYVDQIHRNVSEIGSKLVERLRRAQDETVQDLDDFRNIQVFFNQEYNFLSPAIRDAQANSSDPKTFWTQFEQILGQRNYTFGQQTLTNLNQLEEYLAFFAIMDPSKASKILGYGRLSSIQGWVANTVGKRREWYDFLVRTHEQLSQFQFQSKRLEKSVPSQINISFLTNQSEVRVDQRITEIYAESFLTELDKEVFRSLVAQALEPVVITCKDNNSMEVSGTYIKVSDFFDSNGTYKKCSGATKVQVLASEAIFIDQSIEADSNQTQELTLIAPVWDVVATSSVRFSLSGKNGPDPISIKANNGSSDGANGQAGSPGSPGLPGGYFYGLVDVVKGAEKFSILANGGKGGKGQDGGDGHEGATGMEVRYSEWPSCFDVTHYEESRRYFDSITNGKAGGLEKWCVKYGEPGKQGGSGGSGGIAGVGGYAGKVELKQFQGSQPHYEASVGNSGDCGRGGFAGLGGKRGMGKQGLMATSGLIGCGYQYIEDADKGDRGSSGFNGSDAANSAGQVQPKSASYTQDVNHWEVINNFKALALKNEYPSVRNKFLVFLESSDEIADLYTPTAFSHELLTMENFALTLKPENSLWLRPKYERFLERLDKYAKSKSHTLSSEERKVLAVLYTTAYSKTLSAMERLGSTVVVNVEGYMDTVVERFQRYTQLETKVLVEEQRANYAAIFTKKIEQAISFISETVNPDMDNLEVEQQRASEDLSAALVKLRDETENNLAALEVAKRQMNEATIFRKIFGALKIGGQIASMFGAQGAVIGGIIGSGASIAEQFVLGDYSKGRTEIKLPQSVKDYARNLEIAAKPNLEQKIKETGALVDEAEKAVSTNKEEIGDLEGKIKELKQKRSEIMEGGTKNLSPREMLTKLKELREKENDLKLSMDDKKKTFEGISKSRTASQKEKDRAELGKKVLTKINNVVSLVETSYDVYNKVKNDEAQLDQLSMMIEECEEAIKDIKAKEQAVKDILLPYIASVTESISQTAENLQTQSSVALLVKRWEVKKQLTVYRDFLDDFTEGFDSVSKRFANSVNNLSEAMALIIDLYDYIEKYTEHMQFADYIANLNSPVASSVTVNDPYIPRIQLALQANILLAEYDQSVKAFQQWVFPYGHLFQSEYALSSHIPEYLRNATAISSTPKDITQYLVPNLIQEIQNLKTRLAQYRAASFQNMDVNLITANFNSEGTTSQPFQVWDGETYKDSITDLLTGKRVTLWADPGFTYSAGKSAVKFRLAELQLRARDPQKQARLDNILKEFAVIMTHSGASHYIYSGEPVIMVGDNATLRYNFERDSVTGERLEPNAVYMKVKEGNYILSPYTLWTVQLIKATKNGNGQFEFKDLAAMSDEVYLELVGQGSYVDERDHAAGKSLLTMSLYDFK